MSETRGRKFKALSNITKRLISGPPINTDNLTLSYNNRHFQKEWNGAYLTQISKAFGVTISAKKKANDVFFNITGTPEKIQQVHAILTQLDQHAAHIAKERGLNNPRDIETTDYSLLKVYLRELLNNPHSSLQSNFTNALERPANSDQIVQEAVITAERLIESTVPKAKSVSAIPPKSAKADKGPDSATKESVLKITIPVFKPQNISQAVAYTAMKDPNIDVNFLVGPAGGGKTYVPTHFAFEQLTSGQCNKIYLFRPRTVTGGKDLGALPGDMHKKMEPYVKVFAGKFEEITGKRLPKSDMIQALTPDTERGESHVRAIIIVDEAQNLSIQEAVMLQTRIGQGSRLIFTGDISNHQNDLKGQYPGLAHLLATQIGAANRGDEALKVGMACTAFTEEDSAARHRLLPNILKAFNNPAPEYADLMATIEAAKRDSVLAKAISDAVDYARKQLEEGANRTYGKYIVKVQKAYPELIEHEGNVFPLYAGEPEVHIA